MSVPKSSVLSCNRGFLARVGANLNSPKQSQSQNVNVVVNPYSSVQSSPDGSMLTGARYPDVNGAEPEVKERSVETANETLTNLEQIIHDKDLLIQALVLCLDIVENNPLIVNKYVIAEEDELIKLVQLLCDTNEVELLKADTDTGCCKSSTLDYVSKIYVKKDGNTYNLKYNYSDVCEFLSERKISTKFVKSSGKITYK